MKKSFQLTIYRVVAQYVSKISVEILRQLISLKKLGQLLFVCAALDQWATIRPETSYTCP
jgi:hypothetical protein